MTDTDPARLSSDAIDPVQLDPTQLDPFQLDVAPAPIVASPAPQTVPAATVATAPTAATVATATTEQLTMELAPADHPRVEAARSCPSCGTVAAISDTFCESCGLQLTNDRDHYSEQPARWLAAVTDRGLRHPHNEDASAVDAEEGDGWAVAVVCDGVSSARESDLAALVAARAARDALRPEAGERLDPQSLAERLGAAALEAHQAALRQTTPDSGASCTIAAAVIVDDVAATVSIGDSRVYWLPDQTSGIDPTPSDWGAPRLLSVDDSVAELRVAAGLDRAQAEQASDAHVITGWIGQHASTPEPHPLVVRPDRPGWLLLCTDGLWNYVSAPEDLAVLTGDLARDVRPGALALADALVRWAVDQGGKDNVTVAAGRVPFGSKHPTPPEAAPESN